MTVHEALIKAFLFALVTSAGHSSEIGTSSTLTNGCLSWGNFRHRRGKVIMTTPVSDCPSLTICYGNRLARNVLSGCYASFVKVMKGDS